MKKTIILSVIMLVAFSLFSGCTDLRGSTLLEGHNTGDGDCMTFGNSQAMTFYLDSTATVTSLKLKMFRGGDPGEITVLIQETEDGVPIDVILSVGAFDGDSITVDGAGEWIDIDIADVILDGGVFYAIGVDPEDGAPGVIGWRCVEGESYAKGDGYRSSGESWIENHRDFMFEIWGY